MTELITVIDLITDPDPELVRMAREWVAECSWKDEPEDIEAMSDEEILRGVHRAYEGGLRQFVIDAGIEVA